VTFEPGVSPTQRALVLDHDDLFCAMCGTAPGDVDDLTGNLAAFYVGLISDKNRGGKGELSNLRTLCSTCNQGAKNITTVKPPAIWLLSQIRRAGQEEQRAVLDWLIKKFKE
jgi:5-methylcytosine-specific restriction endonuclease McrA